MALTTSTKADYFKVTNTLSGLYVVVTRKQMEAIIEIVESQELGILFGGSIGLNVLSFQAVNQDGTPLIAE